MHVPTDGVASTPTPLVRAVWLPSVLLAGIWLAVVALAAIVSLTPLTRVQDAVLPAGVTPFIWSWAAPWPIVLPVAGAVAVGTVHAAILAFAPRPTGFAVGWIAAVCAGAAAGLAVDAVLVFGTVFTHGWAMWSLDLGSRAAIGAYWGLLYGWVPALLLRVQSTPRPSGANTRRGWLIAAALLALALLGASYLAGDAATQAQLRAAEAATEPAPADGAARPDPNAAGVPVPERVEGPGVTDAAGCTPENSVLLVGDVDGATGHRGLRLELMNFSETSCVIEGYPDVAFGDQNDHLLDVTVTPGSSFMASDPGPARVEIPAGGSAVAFIGWDANSTHGALVARTIWAAVLAGEERGSKPIQSDIIAGSTVEVTAWALPTSS